MEKKEKDNSLINKIEKELINILVNENNRPIPKKILINKLLKNKFYDLRIIHNVLDDLLNKNKIKYLKNGNIVIDYLIEEIDNKIYIGVISKKSNGNGFITKIDNLANEKPFFVSKNNTIDSMDGDVVKFSLVKKKIINPKDILSDAIVIEVVERAKKFLVAKIEILNDSYKIIPDDETILFDVVLDAINGLVNGDKILIKIKIIENNTIFGSVIKNIGNISDPGVDILSILIENGIEPEFSDEIINLTSKLKFNIDDYQKKIRTNLTELPFVTIDPTESKDFDDAFCVKKMSDGTFYLSVSIADVSHYIDMKSELDKTAFKRGCSIYLIDRVVPMLPHIISDDICSINPNVERLCITCDIMIDAIGDFKKINIYPSIIKSHRRFAYDEVNDFFENNSSINDSEEIKNMLLQSFELHNILNNKKNKNGYINFNLPEPMIKVDENGIPLEIKLKKSGNAQQMIEDFMIAANIAVTIHADHNKWPFIYRVHDNPSIEKIKKFTIEAKKMNFKPLEIDNIQKINSLFISKWLKNNENNENISLINTILLRTMAKAEYSTKNIGHFGLSCEQYTHFTSPIRRYADLIVHRIFWMYEFEKNKYTDAQRQELASKLENICDVTSKNEVVATKCERDVNAMKFAEYMEKFIGNEFCGLVTGISSFGVFVQLENTIEGIIRMSNLKKDYFVYNENNNELLGQNTGMRINIGDKVKIKLIFSSKYNRKIEFELL